MTSMERTLLTLSHKTPDRVPLFLLLAMQGARETGNSIRDYYRDSNAVAEGQRRLLKKYGHDCLYTFHYASIEFEAFGGETIFYDDGPPNAGAPIICSRDDILKLEKPNIPDCRGLQRALDATRKIKDTAGGDTPIIGVVMSPFSLPVMQLGFERYLDVLTGDREAFDRLMRVNEPFCADWANAQLEAGAMAICYFDPVSSPTIIPPNLYRETGWPIAKRMITSIKGPVASHFASGRTIPVIDEVMATGALAHGVSCEENLETLREKTRGKMTLIGNLNGIAMRNWTYYDAAAAVRKCIDETGPGGGFILSDNHGEIPWQVSDETIMAIAEAAREYGRYEGR